VVEEDLLGEKWRLLIYNYFLMYPRTKHHSPQEEEEEELRVQRGPGVNEVSFRARPHHNVHSTLGVDTGATGPRWRVDSIEGGGGMGMGGEESGRMQSKGNK
jgi:hypothetical protein